MSSVATVSADARAWRALGRFWAGVAGTLALVGGGLALLGPPVELPPAVGQSPPAAAATAERPPEAAGASPASAAEGAVAAAAAPSLRSAATEAAGETQGGAPEAAGVQAPEAARPPGAVGGEGTAPRLAPAAVALPMVPPRPARPGPIPPPDPALLEPSRHGPLPRIAPDGTTPARFYARAFDRQDPRPRVAILVGGIGLSARLAQEAIATLPPDVSLALSPYAADTAPILAAARARGMETLVALPLEPQGWPLNDVGDQALLTGLPMEQNLDRLFWALSRFGGQIGAVGALGPLLGERFAAQPGALEAVQRILASRGLVYVDPRPGAPSPGFAWGVAADLVLDDPPGAAAIEARLAALERLAQQRGSALGYAGDASPVLVARIAAWAEGLARRGVVLAPVSALIRRPEPR